MVRTQIQLSEGQAETLKRIAAERDESIAELIRRAVDMFIGSSGVVDPAEIRRRAGNAAGKFCSGRSDISSNHDKYLAGDFEK